MNAETLFYHLRELGVTVALSPDVLGLILDAPTGVMTRELTDLLREHKPELVELAYVECEREAIQWEGSHLNTTPKFRDDETADKRLKRYLGAGVERRDVIGGVPQGGQEYAGNF